MNINELKKMFNTDYKDSSLFAEKARLLQSMWRTEKGYELDQLKKYGNYLKEDFAKSSGANFLTAKIFEIVKNTVLDKEKVIQQPRIWNNLLSSQPLAFNLFGELSLNTDLASNVFKEIYPDRLLSKVSKIDFEFSPGRGNNKYTGDNTAFDVIVEYLNVKNEKCFFGIEVKYAETLNDPPSSDKPNYENISIESKVFNMANLEILKQIPIQQIWRDHLLALSLFISNNDYVCGDYIFLYPNDNENCQNAILKYKQTFNTSVESYFKPLALEKLVGIIKQHCNEKWILDFEDRYLRFDKIDNAMK